MNNITNEYDSVVDMLKMSSIDYPMNISSVLYYSGCNLRCPYCRNIDLALGRSVAKLTGEEIEKILVDRKDKIDHVVITGGEPTMRSTVIWLTRRLSNLGFKIKLDTNGLRPRILGQCNIDYLAMDLKALPERYERLLKSPGPSISRIKESLDIVKKFGNNAEVRITMAHGIVEPGTIQTLKRLLEGVHNVYLQRAHLSNVLSPNVFEGIKEYTEDEMLSARNALLNVVNNVSIRW